MKKKICLLGLLIVTMIMLCSCKMDSTGSVYKEHIYVDKETGVNYIWINSDTGVAMQPRYNADGTLYVTKIN